MSLVFCVVVGRGVFMASFSLLVGSLVGPRNSVPPKLVNQGVLA